MHPECRHIKPNGYKCRSAALRHSPYCYFHTSVHALSKPGARPEELKFKLPLLEDRSAIQLALVQILDALVTGNLEAKPASLMLYGLQIASQNVERTDPILPKNTVIGLTHTGDGQELGPKNFACDVPEDCAKCNHREICLLRRTIVGLHGGVDPLDEPAGDDGAENEEDENDSFPLGPRRLGIGSA